MTSVALTPTLIVSGVVFLVVDIILFVAIYLYCRRKKNFERKEADERELLIIKSEPLKVAPVKSVNIQDDIFEIPLNDIKKDGAKMKLVQTPFARKATTKKNPTAGKLDISNYISSTKRSLSSIPRLGFELFYDFRTTQLKITLKAAKHLPKYFNEQVIISIIMSHSPIIYQSSKVDGPYAIFNEEYPFPLDSMEISSDPPITAKFNVWHIDKNSRKNAYGYVQVNIEDVLSQTGIPTDGESTGKIEWRNIIVCDQLTDEGLKGEILLTLSYLSAAQRIGVTVVKAKGLILTANDKDLYVKTTLMCRDEDHNNVVTNYVPLSQNPDFNQEFIFRFSDLRNASIEGVALRIEVVARQVGLLEKPRIIGHCYLGKSDKVDRHGKEHWVTMLTAPKSVTNWHTLKEASCGL